ncbi:class II histone deacetylase [Lysinibacillus agricola]|uniref:class II histone deacetylase n=1 Tax=Lysinibacillus agricola TaxID=2590012 RepID=UPI003C1FCDCF
MKKTAFICDESYFWHDTGNGALFSLPGGYVQSDGHAESPETKRRFKNLLERSGLYEMLHKIKPYAATEDQLEYFHTKDYIQKVKELSHIGHGDAGELALVGNGSYEIAQLSVGGAITAVEAVVKGECDNAYALTRPPGHHAEANLGMGFCLFNNVVIAAHYARKELGLERVMILDWDVHHGNGTESAFYHDPNVLFISIHQEGLFPAGRGESNHIGEDAAKGTTVNIPLPAGTGDAGYMYALEKIVKPIADDFKPQLIIISAGQDASIFDPLGRMMVSAEGYRKMTKFMMQLAESNCGGKLVAVHEGGYSTAYVPFCSHAIVEELSGITTDVEDPFIHAFNGVPFDQLSDHQKERIDAIKSIHIKQENF